MLITILFPLHEVVMVILFAATYPRISLTEGRKQESLCFPCCCDPIYRAIRDRCSHNEDWNTFGFRCIDFPKNCDNVDGLHGYIMMAKCPSNGSGTVDTTEECEFNKVSITCLPGLPLFDKATNLTYANSYCAQYNSTLREFIYYREKLEEHPGNQIPEQNNSNGRVPKRDVCSHKYILTQENFCSQIQQLFRSYDPSETFWSHIRVAPFKREVLKPTCPYSSSDQSTVVGDNSTKATKQCNGPAFPPEEYVLWPNNSVFVSSQNKIYDNNSYVLVNKTLIVCSNSSPTSFPGSLWSGGDSGNEVKLQQDRALGIVNYVGFSMSITALLFFLLTYFLFAELRTYPGKTVMHLSCALIAMQLTYLVSSEVVSLVMRSVLGVLLHYFILAVFLWTSAIAHDTQKTFTTLGAESDCRLSRPARLYAISIPVSLLLLFNLIALIRTVVAIKLLGNTRAPHKKKLPTIVLKLIVIMGMTWIPGIAAAFLPDTHLEYPFFIVNSLQGVLICFSFLCKRQIITLYKKKFARSRPEISFVFVVSANTTNSNKVSGYSRKSSM
ncbi:uncharacterized protein [Acropora muricata]|uniref:uncharacterized protein isoform X3 n=1 Tax=Acropora muricata TaxID=159855 RepID=UPI0034E5467B